MARVAHDTGWSAWLKSGDRRDDKKLRWFAVHCWKSECNRSRAGNTYSTVNLKIASIRWMHRRHVGVDLAPSPKFKLLMRDQACISTNAKEAPSHSWISTPAAPLSQSPRPSTAFTIGLHPSRLLLRAPTIRVPLHRQGTCQTRSKGRERFLLGRSRVASFAKVYSAGHDRASRC